MNIIDMPDFNLIALIISTIILKFLTDEECSSNMYSNIQEK